MLRETATVHITNPYTTVLRILTASALIPCLVDESLCLYLQADHLESIGLLERAV